jgi:hypothetical protein
MKLNRKTYLVVKNLTITGIILLTDMDSLEPPQYSIRHFQSAFNGT